MSAPSIPHLGTLRKGARGGARGATFSNRNTASATSVDKDKIIRATDGDASSSRVSAVEAGYLEDPFAMVLSGDTWARRLPLMNRGTYVRTTAIDRIVDTFLSMPEAASTPTNSNSALSDAVQVGHKHVRRQIISLGAGSDTRYLRLKRDKRHNDFTYHELDFAENNQAKIRRLKDARCIELVKKECEVDMGQAQINPDETELNTDEYSVHSIDLRAIPSDLPWLDTDAPTLLISECCLIYLSPESADDALKHFSRKLSIAPLAIAIYEPFRPNDPFGQTMIRNLMGRGIVLQTIEKYADLDKQRARLENLDMAAKAVDCEGIWRSWVDRDEKERVEKLEWMDEVEEFVLLAKHYCVAWGWRGFGNDANWGVL